MKVAIVHDYLREYGGAERVLEALCEVFPKAPIYTAFVVKDAKVYEHFKDREIITSWGQKIPFFVTKLHSPLRFLAPFIWNSFDFKDYDVVITSASWYITKGVKKSFTDAQDKGKPIEICYCHTPPRWLYGYKTSVEWQKYWPVRAYATIIGHMMRMYDFKASQRVNFFIANSNETKERIEKFYRREATVIYPPVSLPQVPKVKREAYYFMVARLVGAKGLDLAVKTAIAGGFQLKIAGVSGGYYGGVERLKKIGKGHVEFLGYVTDSELGKLYAGAKGFLALAEDEDFGITPVEAMLCGTPVIAFYGGGYKETVIDGETGVFFNEPTVESLLSAIKRFETLQKTSGKQMESACKTQARQFSKDRFKKEIKEFVAETIKTNA